MKVRSKLVLLVYLANAPLLSLPLEAVSYEQATHAAMTREAMMQSLLNPQGPDLLQRLGVWDRQVSFGNTYLDLADGGMVLSRSNAPTGVQYPQKFAKTKILDANRQSPFKPEIESLPGWLMLGAIREDDVPFDAGALENNPQDEPGGATNRVLNHFYDPYNDRPLKVGLLQLGRSAPDWALIDTGNQAQDEPGNHFSVLRAREAMWRAATLKSSPLAGFSDLPFSPTVDLPTKEALRTAYWATTFRTLGDVLHLLQDMAQPQHTRNDPHSGLYCNTAKFCPGGHASFYEKYVDARVVGRDSFTLRERTVWESPPGSSGAPRDSSVNVLIARVPYGGYPIPRFVDFRSYFLTATKGASTSGYGLANYSNQGFYSVGTNLGSADVAEYPSPSPTGAGLIDATIPNGSVTDTAGNSVSGTLGLKVAGVVDAGNPSQTAAAVRLSSYGLFDQFLKAVSKSQYTLNHYNYDDQMRLLIPRAVAYSAGLLDYFFRGRMEISLPDEGVYGILDHAQLASQGPTDVLAGFKGFKRIRLRLSNSTPAIVAMPDGTKVPQPMTSGTLVAVVKFHRNACYSDRLDGEITDTQQLPQCRMPVEEIVVSDPLKVPEQAIIPMSDASPGSQALTFTFPNALPVNAWDVVLQVVYRGQLGNESDAVVIATRDISEPTFISSFNDTDKILIAGACYDPATVAATDALWNQLNSTCKPPAGGTRYVTSTCANVPLNVRLTTGNGPSAVTVSTEYAGAQDQRIAPRRFSRIAILGDVGTQTTMTLALNNGLLMLQGSPTLRYSNYRAQQQNQVTFAANTYSTSLSTVGDSYVRHRGVKAWQGQYFVVDGATATVNGRCPEAQLDPLSGAERDPQASIIVGWDDH